jgi:hypothetical protein
MLMSDIFKSKDFGPPRSVAAETEDSTYQAGDDLRFAQENPPPTPLDEAKARAQLEIEHLQDELYLLQDRLATIGARTRNVVEAQRSSINASAHAQLGDHPWLKLAGASIATYAFAKLARHLPFGLLAALAVGKIDGEGRRRSHRRRRIAVSD